MEKPTDYGLFVNAGIASLNETIESQPAIDGDEFLAYLRAKSRGENPLRPRPKSFRKIDEEQALRPL
jgi:hypothetical protein